MTLPQLAFELLHQAMSDLVEGRSGSALVKLRSLETVMELSDETEMPKQDKKVLLLLLATGEHVVCDEYYPNDYGRVHIIPQSQYGTFNINSMEIEYCKVTQHVLEIVYEDYSWPKGLTAPSADQVLTYFGVA